MPSCLEIAGVSEDPWTLVDDDHLAALQSALKKVFPLANIVVNRSSPVYNLVSTIKKSSSLL